MLLSAGPLHHCSEDRLCSWTPADIACVVKRMQCDKSKDTPHTQAGVNYALIVALPKQTKSTPVFLGICDPCAAWRLCARKMRESLHYV